MQITKHGHACLELFEQGQRLIIDPGNFTEPFTAQDVAVVVITHEHPDHWDAEHLRALRQANPQVPIVGPAGFVRAAGEFDPIEVSAGQQVQFGPFSLEFFGGTHAVIHSSVPVIDNLGVMINDTLYYPGDSYVAPGREVEVLAAPAGAPWLKIGEAMDFVLDVAPRQAFGTHVHTLSSDGLDMHHARLQWATEHGGGRYHKLQTGDSIQV